MQLPKDCFNQQHHAVHVIVGVIIAVFYFGCFILHFRLLMEIVLFLNRWLKLRHSLCCLNLWLKIGLFYTNIVDEMLHVYDIIYDNDCCDGCWLCEKCWC
jgi:hypothetical protein